MNGGCSNRWLTRRRTGTVKTDSTGTRGWGTHRHRQPRTTCTHASRRSPGRGSSDKGDRGTDLRTFSGSFHKPLSRVWTVKGEMQRHPEPVSLTRPGPLHCPSPRAPLPTGRKSENNRRGPTNFNSALCNSRIINHRNRKWTTGTME